MRVDILVLMIFIMLSSVVSAQLTTSLSWQQDSVVIGQEVDIILSVKTDSNEEIVAVPRLFLDSVYSALQTLKANPGDTTEAPIPQIADFDVVDMGNWHDDNEDGIFSGDELNWTIDQVGGSTIYEHRFTLRLWDPGQNMAIIPPVLFSVDGQAEQHNSTGFTTVLVVPPPHLAGIPQDSIPEAPIKPIVIEEKNISDYLIYFLIVGAILLAGIFHLLFIKWKRKSIGKETIVNEPLIIEIPAHEQALQSLTKLKSKELWQQGKIKEYQSELTEIIRQYLEDRYEVPALESTTHEIMASLSAFDLQLGDLESLRRILQVADLVKFAKATPTENIHSEFMNEAEQFVHRTKNLDNSEEA